MDDICRVGQVFCLRVVSGHEWYEARISALAGAVYVWLNKKEILGIGLTHASLLCAF